jgi:hypothetical protein
MMVLGGLGDELIKTVIEIVDDVSVFFRVHVVRYHKEEFVYNLFRFKMQLDAHVSGMVWQWAT